MKKFFVFAVMAIFMVAAAQANNVDTINVTKITYKPTIRNKVINIAKGDSVVLTGVDSLVVVKRDSASASELVKVYVNGKPVIVDWLKEGYISSSDPADTTAKKIQIVAIGGDEDGPESNSFPLGWGILSVMVILSFFGWLWWKRS